MRADPRKAFSLAALAVAGVVLASACSDDLQITVAGDFNAPTGVTTVSAADRDFLVVGNAGTSELRAINMCVTSPDAGPLPDGGPGNTCPPEQDFKFVPGPIRLFPAAFPVDTRPQRLAGARLQADGGARGGAVLIAGAAVTATPRLDGGIGPPGEAAGLNAIHIVDANAILEVERGTAKEMPAPQRIVLPGPAVDVVAADQAAPESLGFALTARQGDLKAHLIGFALRLEGQSARVEVRSRCTIDFVGTRLAMVPGSTARLYVADGSPDGVAGGRGDGAVELDVAALLATGLATPAAACPAGRRIPATDTYSNPPRPRPLAALALSPEVIRDVRPSSENGGPEVCPGGVPAGADGFCAPLVDIAAGELLMGITAAPGTPADPTDPNAGKEAGKLVFVHVPTGRMAPVPPYDLRNTSVPVMKPISVPGNGRDVAFLTPPPRDKCPEKFPERPCGVIFVGGDSRRWSLAAAATSNNGSTYFIDATARRFFNERRDFRAGTTALGPTPTFKAAPNLVPTPVPGNTEIPALELAPADAATPEQGGRGAGLLTAGVTRDAIWRATFHAAIPGLERRSGTIRRTTGTGGVGYRLELPGAQIDKLVALSASCGQPGRYCLGIGAGDVVSFLSFSPLPGATLCEALVAENIAPPRELEIAALAAESIDLGAETRTPAGLGPFADVPESCFPAVATIEARTGKGLGNRPWLVSQGPELRGRVGWDQQFFGLEPRFDYPLDLPEGAAQPPPQWTEEIGLSFTLRPPPIRNNPNDPNDPGTTPCPDCVDPKTTFFIDVNSGQFQTGSSSQSSIFASSITVYNSPKITNLVFTAVTGANEVLQIDPALIGLLSGTIAYR